ncbi:facilitated trehalose transporter Tret1-like [Bacillus rossius redtenbacheri]|uniref:facilitated trehalose transporter Tret1-like n=1 Tax=Bacillus rossius redtenbacheri TaxID=93214 RepID=UPI002FDE5429
MEDAAKKKDGGGVKVDVDAGRAYRAPSKLPQYVAAVVANLAAFTQGTIVGWMSPVVDSLKSDNSPIGDSPMTDDQVSLLGAMLCAGATVMTPVYSYLANNYSRKLTGYLVGIPPVVCWIMKIFATSNVTLYVARFFIGCVGAGNTILCPLYVTETADDTVRGSLGTYVMLFFYVGVLFSSIVGGFTDYKTFSTICLTIPLVFMFCFFWIPESPFYLIMKNKQEEARKALMWLRSGDKNAVEETMSTMMETIRRSKHDRAKKATMKDLFSDIGARKAMIISLGMVANNQLCGFFAVLTFTVTIFQESGSGLSPVVSSIIVGCLQCLGTFLTAALVDRAGRKILLVISNVGLSACLIVLSFHSYFKFRGYDVSSYGWVPIVCLCCYVVFIGLGIGTIPYIIMNEIFSPELRGKALTICLMVLWVLAFLVARYFIPVSDVFGLDVCYGFFALCCVAGAFFSHFVVPETKNRSLDSILKELSGNAELGIPLQAIISEKESANNLHT